MLELRDGFSAVVHNAQAEKAAQRQCVRAQRQRALNLRVEHVQAELAALQDAQRIAQAARTNEVEVARELTIREAEAQRQLLERLLMEQRQQV